MDRIATGEIDKNGRQIFSGDMVYSGDGFYGRVVFANAAFRIDIDDGAYLGYNSSLLYKEGKGTTSIVVIDT